MVPIAALRKATPVMVVERIEPVIPFWKKLGVTATTEVPDRNRARARTTVCGRGRRECSTPCWFRAARANPSGSVLEGEARPLRKPLEPLEPLEPLKQIPSQR